MDIGSYLEHKKHREYVTRTTGEWIGIINSAGVPIMDIAEYTNLSAPENHLAGGNLEITCAITGDVQTNPLVKHFISEDFQTLDLAEITMAGGEPLFICIERYGQKGRQVFFITHAVAEGSDRPEKITIHGADAVEILRRLPAFSVPLSVKGEWVKVNNDHGRWFSKPLWMQDIETAAQADGFTVKGGAENIIRKVITDSINTLYKALGVVEKPYVVSQTPSGVESPQVYIVLDDSDIFQTVEKAARVAGVSITASFWMPGDLPVDGDKTFTHPVIVYTVTQNKK